MPPSPPAPPAPPALPAPSPPPARAAPPAPPPAPKIPQVWRTNPNVSKWRLFPLRGRRTTQVDTNQIRSVDDQSSPSCNEVVPLASTSPQEPPVPPPSRLLQNATRRTARQTREETSQGSANKTHESKRLQR